MLQREHDKRGEAICRNDNTKRHRIAVEAPSVRMLRRIDHLGCRSQSTRGAGLRMEHRKFEGGSKIRGSILLECLIWKQVIHGGR